MAPNENYDHILFLDNLRYLLVLLVVVLHATFAYSKFVPWWCVKELKKKERNNTRIKKG